MKRVLPFIAVLMLGSMMLTACGKSGGGSGNPGVNQNNFPGALPDINPFDPRTYSIVGYGFNEGNRCTTGQRVFANADDMCFFLQHEATNKSCAYQKRLAFFNNQCPGRQFDPARARDVLRNSGKLINCSFTEGQDRRRSNRARNRRSGNELEQMTHRDALLMQKPNSNAVVRQFFDGRTYRVRIDIFDKEGRHLTREEREWRDASPEPFMAYAPAHYAKPSVSCYPEIRPQKY